MLTTVSSSAPPPSSSSSWGIGGGMTSSSSSSSNYGNNNNKMTNYHHLTTTTTMIESSNTTTNNNNNNNNWMVKQQRRNHPSSSSSTSTSSTSLSCLSPNGRYVYSFGYSNHDNNNRPCIFTHSLPLAGTTDDDDDDTDKESSSSSTSFITYLPTYVEASIRMDEPLELICVDHDSSNKNNNHHHHAKNKKKNRKKEEEEEEEQMMILPWLCLYSSKAAYLLQIGSSIIRSANDNDNDNDNDNNHNSGEVLKCIEPFESYLLQHPTAATTSQQEPTCILRIRSAPQSNTHHHHHPTYHTLCPVGSMAMLTNEHALVLYHGVPTNNNNNDDVTDDATTTTTVPVRMEMEPCFMEGNGATMDSLVDFSFVPSDNLFASMTVVFTTLHTGTVYMANPIFFHGTIYPKSQVSQAQTYLKQQQQQLQQQQQQQQHTNNNKDYSAATWRRNKAAQQFLLDAFYPHPTNNNNSTTTTTIRNNNNHFYMTAHIANIMNHGKNGNGNSFQRNATAWPVQMQGPIALDNVNNNNDDDDDVPLPWNETAVVSMELLPTSNQSSTTTTDTVGMVLARANHMVQYALLLCGNSIVPRFAFESNIDSMELNDDIVHSGMIIEQLQLGTPPSQESSSSSVGTNISLQLDPIDPNMIHHISNRRVITISTNIMDIKNCQLNQLLLQNDDDNETIHPITTNNNTTVKTMAWCSLQISTGGNYPNDLSLNGVVISGDIQLGHVLIARLSNGAMEAINITASQYLNEASSLNLMNVDEKLSSSQALVVLPSYNNNNNDKIQKEEDDLKSIQAIPPFYEIAEPLFHQITKGMSGLSKIVGGATKPTDVDAASLAIFLATKQRCEEEIVLPLTALRDVTTARTKLLKATYTKQMAQLQQLQKQIADWKKLIQTTKQKMKTVEAQSKLINQRSAAVLAAARDLTPTITEAEYQYFTQLKRYDVTCSKWEHQMETLGEKANTIQEKVQHDSYSCAVQLSKEQLNLCTDLLKGEETLLERNAIRMKQIESQVQLFKKEQQI